MLYPHIFDTDHHVTPPKDFWTKRVPAKYKELAPKVVDNPEGEGQAWTFNDGEWYHVFGLENVGSMDPTSYGWNIRWDDMHPACYDPKERLKIMDADYVRAALLFPNVVRHLETYQDDDLSLTCLRAYNDGIMEWSEEGDSMRLIPAAVMPRMGVELAVEEVYRTAKRGFRHYQYNGMPSGGTYPSAADEPFWAALQETGMVLSMHGAGAPPRVKRPAGAPVPKAPPRGPMQVGVAAGRGAGLGVPVPLAQLVLTGVLERYPRLKVGLIETSAGWLPGYLEQMDNVYTHNRTLGGKTLKLLPSDYIHRQVKISIDRESTGIRNRYQIGVDKLMLGTDYPHIGSFFPHTRRYVELLFNGVPEDESAAILWGNAATLYGLN